MHEPALFALAGILALGAACQWVAWRVKLPAILFLLASGVLVGPVLGWLRPDALLGDLLFPFVSLAVAVILFEGSLTLRFRDIRGLGSVIRNLITVGVAITLGITAVATRLTLGLSWELSFLFGAVMVVTGPTVIAPMLRAVRPTQSVGRVLLWEGILIDPIGATLAVLVYQCIVAESIGGGLATGGVVFGRILTVGLVCGSAAGYACGTVLKRYLLPQYLHNVFTLALVCGLFALSNALAPEAGLLSVTVMGIWLANMDIVELEEILAFKESLSLLLISSLFILLAARTQLAGFAALGWKALGVFAAIQFLARPISASGRPGVNCATSELICQAIADATGADAVIHGKLSTKGLDGPAVTIADLFQLVPYENNIVLAEVTPDELAAIVSEQWTQRDNYRFCGLWGRSCRINSAGKATMVDNVRRSGETGTGNRAPKATAGNVQAGRLILAMNSHTAAGSGVLPVLTSIIRADAARCRDSSISTRDCVEAFLRQHPGIVVTPRQWLITGRDH